MLALVTGGAGFLARHLAKELLARGHHVRALVRPGTGVAHLDARVQVRRGDALDPASVRDAVAGCELVYHLAGIRRAPDRDAFHRGNVESTRLLLEACVARGAAGHRFVLAGSLAAAGPSRDGKDEADPYEPEEWYGESKAEAERLALSFSDRLPTAIGCPPRIIGPGDRENLALCRIVARGVVVRLLGPVRPLSWIDVGDCARGFVLLGEHPLARGERFFLASAERTTAEALQRAAARALEVRTRTVPMPATALRLLGTAADLVSRATGTRLPLNRKLARQLLAPGWTCRTEKAERRLGFTATTPLQESVARSIRAYREDGLL